ncbi:MAG: DUF2244 domain-containing protein [Pseudomonadota bacterium]
MTGDAQTSRLAGGEEGEAPLLSLTLWPHRSLSPRGFRLLLAVAAIGLAIPLIPILGTGAAWVLAGFVVADLALLYFMVQLTYRSGRVRERLTVWRKKLRVVRTEPNGVERVWEANPHWVRVDLHDTPKIRKYLVLSASGRQVELGSFLTPDERVELAETLRETLRRAASAPL